MIRENQRLFNLALYSIDIAVIIFAFLFSWVLRFNSTFFEEGEAFAFSYYLYPLIAIVPIYIILYSIFDLYQPSRRRGLTEETVNILKANFVVLIILMSMLFFIRHIDYSRLLLFIFSISATIFTIIERLTLRKLLRYLRKQGFNIKHILVIGAGELGREFISKIQTNKTLGYNILGVLDDNKPIGRTINGANIMGRTCELEQFIQDSLVDEIIITLSFKEYDKLKDIIKTGEKTGVKVQIIPDYLKYIPAKPHIDEIDGLPLINIRHVPLDNYANKLVKRLFDIFGSLCCILLFSPIMIIVAVLIKLESPGPIIFKQERVGLNRKSFTMYKFRSMRMQTKEDEDKKWTTQDDPRKTKIGEFIRKTSIDELPQIFNVLFGDMSLVGPRPERPFFVVQFKERIPKYMIKHQVRPGITGWAQVNGWRGDTSIKERIKCDIYYIENWTLALDIKILIFTVFKGFINKNAY